MAGALLLVSLSGCGGEPSEAPEASTTEHAGEAHAEGEAGEPTTVRLDPETQKEFAIEVATAGPGWIEKSTSLPAEVRPNQDRLAHIAPRFPGIAREVRAQIGDSVKAGQELAVIESGRCSSLAQDPIDGLVTRSTSRAASLSRASRRPHVADLRDVWIDISVYQNDSRSSASAARRRLCRARARGMEGRSPHRPCRGDGPRRGRPPEPSGIWRPGL
jgi:cobalt-zinc-cadmium efflux system membrane fusion protein